MENLIYWENLLIKNEAKEQKGGFLSILASERNYKSIIKKKKKKHDKIELLAGTYINSVNKSYF